MPCYKPLQGYLAQYPNPSGKRSIVFNPKHGMIDRRLEVPCGRCIGCRLERSRQWSVRIMHEAQLHQANAFLTLTYDDENLPEDGSLNVKHFQDFMKRYRKSLGDRKIRFYHCGEYGTLKARPHYHACIFGHDFEDKKLWKVHRDNPWYTSEKLSSLWPHGYSLIGHLTFQSAAYVARYIMKKQLGPDAVHLAVNPETGECRDVLPEYTTMSRRPGIAAGWYEKYGSEVHPADNVVVNGRKQKPPRYYDNLYQVEEPEAFEELKARRRAAAKKSKDNTRERLDAREKVKLAQISNLKRPYDEATS